MDSLTFLRNALSDTLQKMDLEMPARLVVEEPKDERHGDLSTNAALLLAKNAGKNPRQLATEIADRLVTGNPAIEKVEVAGPGFCNIFFKPDFWQQYVSECERTGGAYGHNSCGAGEKVLVEYVSANPTGPLHVGHGRGAAVGDSVARLLRASGYDVATEYYLNDAGRQMRNLGLSIWLRALELKGDAREFPEDCYRGEYIYDLAREVLTAQPDLTTLAPEKALAICQEYGINTILGGIRQDLAEFRCEHQQYFSELSLVKNGSIEKAFAALAQSGNSYEKDGALWFASTSFGDDRDRVLRKSDGLLTYFATDIAYHHDKFQRGYNWLVDVWGADHHGYIPRLRGAILNMGHDAEKFSVLLIQLVNLLRDGRPVSMSTRAGEFVTLKAVIQEVGVDSARFLFLSRSPDSPLDFDLEMAKRRNLDNPVYYVQYAHARICAVLRRARERDISLADSTHPEILRLLDGPEDIGLLRKIGQFEDIVRNAAQNLAPQFVSAYLMGLAAKLHGYYSRNTILTEDSALAHARLALLRAVGQTLRNGLFLLGVSAPESM